MLRFSQEQQSAILNNRRALALSAANMANAYGDMTGIGNAYALPKDIWEQWDGEIVQLQRQEMLIFNDLASSLTTNMPIGKLLNMFRAVSDSGEVNISMDGRSKARMDKPVYEHFGTPVPLLDSTYGFGWREMEVAATEGFNLDGAARINSNEKIARKLESLALDGDASVVVAGNSLYGLRNHPSRKTRTTGQPLNGATGAQWLAEFTATIKLLRDAGYWGALTVYVNASDWFYASNTDYTAGYPKTIAQRIREIEGIASILPAPTIAAGQIIAFIKDKRFVQVLNAMPLVNRGVFRANPEDDYNFVAMAAAAVQVKRDYEGNTALAVSSLA